MKPYFFRNSDEFPPLGVEKELVSDAQMTASSASDPVKASAGNGRLNFNNAWCSATSNEEPLFLQIDLNEMHIITAVSQSQLEKDLSHSSSFVIRANLLQPQPSLFRYGY